MTPQKPQPRPSPPLLPLTPTRSPTPLQDATPGYVGSLGHRSSPLTPQTHPNPLRALQRLAQRCLQMGLLATSCPECPSSQQTAQFWCRIVQRKPQNEGGLSILKIPRATEATPGTHQPGASLAALQGRLSSCPGAGGCRDAPTSSNGAAETLWGDARVTCPRMLHLWLCPKPRGSGAGGSKSMPG